MKSATIVSTLLGGATALNVVQFDIYRVEDSALSMSKRDTIDGLLSNQYTQYNLNLTIGTPPQPFSLQLDTGSSDLWVNIAESAFCSAADSPCLGGVYSRSASSTYQDSIPGGFDISYVDNSGASGDYGLDTVVVGGVTILNQTFGVANVSDITAGLIGVAFSDNEAICNSPIIGPCTKVYPSVVDQMVSQGKINSRAYSLWLNDFNATTGSILFGGIDTSKYQGDLVELDIQPTYSNDTFTQYKDFNVVWSNLSIQGVENFWDESSTTLATLDSGTASTYLPPNVYDALASAFNVSSKADGYAVNCSLAAANMTFDFTFGGPDGVTIAADISKFVYNNGDGTCSFGMFPSDQDVSLLGDTFLRSAYVVYDLDNKKIAMAQTDFNGGEPNVIEIDQSGIPNVSSTASAIAPSAATSAAATQSEIGPVTATGTVASPPATYTGAGVVVRAGSKYALGCVVVALTVFMAI